MKMNFKKLASAAMNRGGGAVAGGVASLAINKVIPSSINPKIKGIGKILLGAIIPEFAPKSKFIESAGVAFAGAAAAELAADMIPALSNKVSGIGSDEAYVIDEDSVRVSGSDDVMSGSDSVMSGVDGEESSVVFE